MRPFALAFLVFVCTGCATQAERSAQMQREVEDMIAVYGPACEKLGYARDSDVWRNCVLRLNTNEAIVRYSTAPTTTTCFGHRGFFQCSRF